MLVDFYVWILVECGVELVGEYVGDFKALRLFTFEICTALKNLRYKISHI